MDRYVISVSDIPVTMKIGVCDWEQLRPSKLLVSVRLTAAPGAYDRKTIDTCIDYSSVVAFIRDDLPAMPHTPLIETVAEQVLDHCFAAFSLSEASVTVKKPHIFDGDGIPAVTLTRSG